MYLLIRAIHLVSERVKIDTRVKLLTPFDMSNRQNIIAARFMKRNFWECTRIVKRDGGFLEVAATDRLD